MWKRKEKIETRPRKFPSVAKTETESPESQAGDKLFGAAGKGGDKKRKVWFPLAGQQSKIPRQTHAHTHKTHMEIKVEPQVGRTQTNIYVFL